MRLANTFSHSVGCHFVDGFFLCGEAFYLMQPHLFSFALWPLLLVSDPKIIAKTHVRELPACAFF